MYKGLNLYFDTIETNDMPTIYQWFEDVEFLKTYDYTPPIPRSKDEVDIDFAEYMKKGEKNEAVIFAIKTITDNKLIGIAGFDDILIANKVATLFIGIGDSNSQGKGYGKEALKLLLQYGFTELDLYKIQLDVIEFNYRAIHLYENSGFKKEGIRRQFILRNDIRYDLHSYGLLKKEHKNI